jgi:hypothetical protein
LLAQAAAKTPFGTDKQKHNRRGDSRIAREKESKTYEKNIIINIIIAYDNNNYLGSAVFGKCRADRIILYGYLHAK